MKKILVLGINNNTHTTSRILEELRNKKIPYDFIKWNSLLINEGKFMSGEKTIDFKKYLAIFYDVPTYYVKLKTKKQRISFDLHNEFNLLLKEIKENKIPAINRDFFLKNSFYNKLTQSVIFYKNKIDSIPAIHLSDNKYEKVLSILKTNCLRFPVVVKESNGGFGRKVWKLNSKKELKKFLANKRSLNLIYQPFIKNTGDFRVLVVGGKSLGIMQRFAKKGEWKNNFALGGKTEKFSDRKMEKFAEKTCQKMGMDYAGVDILKTKKRYTVIEVNSFACFEGFEKTYPSVNVAEKIINYLITI